MEIFAWSFTKRENSTRQPSYDDGVTLTGTFKESVNIMSPVVEIGGAFDMTEAPPYNYMEIPYFKRYYFVRSWEYNSGFWTAYLEVDALASWRDSIGEQEQYILRASASSDGNIVDSLYPADARILENITQASLSLEDESRFGAYIVGVVGQAPNTLGAVTYYALTLTQLQTILGELFTDVSWSDIDFSAITDMTSELWRSLFNPLQYIVSCVYIPYFPTNTGLAPFYLGYYQVTSSTSYTTIDPDYITANLGTLTMSLHNHPQASSRGSYLNGAPYTHRMLHNSMFGDIPLNDSLLARSDSLQLSFTLDLITGALRMNVFNVIDGVRAPLFNKTIQIGVPISMAQVSRDYLGVISSVAGVTASGVGAIASGVFGNVAGVAGSIAGVVSGITSAIESYTPTCQTSGSNGNMSAIDPVFYLSSEHHYIVDEDNANLGRPLCKSGIPSDYAGYLLIRDADVSLKATKAEQQMIKNYMDTGFFYQ